MKQVLPSLPVIPKIRHSNIGLKLSVKITREGSIGTIKNSGNLVPDVIIDKRTEVFEIAYI
ncbi:MAG: hypothetical protein WCT02_02185 [Candidatus Paceibacterota bacterium]